MPLDECFNTWFTNIGPVFIALLPFISPYNIASYNETSDDKRQATSDDKRQATTSNKQITRRPQDKRQATTSDKRQANES